MAETGKRKVGGWAGRRPLVLPRSFPRAFHPLQAALRSLVRRSRPLFRGAFCAPRASCGLGRCGVRVAARGPARSRPPHIEATLTRLALPTDPPRQAKKDPLAPTRARSAYQLWANATRGELAAANPDEGMGGISKLLGARWKETGACVGGR